MPLKYQVIYNGPVDKCELVLNVCNSMRFSTMMNVRGWTRSRMLPEEWIVLVIGSLQECDIAYLRAFADGVVAGAATDAV